MCRRQLNLPILTLQCIQQTLQRRGRARDEQVSRIPTGCHLAQHLGSDLCAGHAVELDLDVGVLGLEALAQHLGALAALGANDRHATLLTGGGEPLLDVLETRPALLVSSRIRSFLN